jgi:PAS domain S-box-containing protein
MRTLLRRRHKEEQTICVFEQTNVQEEYEIHLRENERRLREAERLAKLGHWELDIPTGELHWSAETFRIFGLNPEEHEPSYETFLAMIHPGDRDYVRQQYEDSVQNRTQYNVYHRLILRSGETKFVNERCRTIYDESGRPTRSLGTILDMSEHEREIEKLIRAEAGLEVYAHGLEEESELLSTQLEMMRSELEEARELITLLQAKIA